VSPILSTNRYGRYACLRYVSLNLRQVIFALPITHFAHGATVSDRDESESYRGKDVFIISGPHKGWRGTLVSLGPDTCVIERGAFSMGTYNKTSVVIRQVFGSVCFFVSDRMRRGMGTTLAGEKLTPLQVIAVSNAFTRGILPSNLHRQLTPPPSPSAQCNSHSQPAGSSTSNPWVINNDDGNQAESSTPRSCKSGFRCIPTADASTL
jgi:hypothetical protein